MPPLPEPITRNFSFYELGPGYVPFGGVPAGALGNLAVVYFHTHEALELADLLKIPYDYNPPLYVVGFSGPGYGAGWDGRMRPQDWKPGPGSGGGGGAKAKKAGLTGVLSQSEDAGLDRPPASGGGVTATGAATTPPNASGGTTQPPTAATGGGGGGGGGFVVPGSGGISPLLLLGAGLLVLASAILILAVARVAKTKTGRSRGRGGRPSAKVVARLEICGPGGGTRSWAVKPGVSTIGRDADNDLVLDDPAVSRRHAFLTVEGGHFTIRDEGSRSGVWVNKQRVQEAALYANDEILLGSTTFVLRSD